MLTLCVADAPGNSFLKPNGVVWIENVGGGDAYISTPEIYASREKQLILPTSRGIDFAVQFGPLLLIDGKRRLALTENSASKLPRNGVGVDATKQLIFAITVRGELGNFWNFSGLHLKLGCRDSLFLDGDISQMVVNPDKTVPSNQFGAMFVVAE